jgi:hypothetical protein
MGPTILKPPPSCRVRRAGTTGHDLLNRGVSASGQVGELRITGSQMSGCLSRVATRDASQLQEQNRLETE